MKTIKYFIFLAIISFGVIGNVQAASDKVGAVTINQTQQSIKQGLDQVVVQKKGETSSDIVVKGKVVFQVSSEDAQLSKEKRRAYLSFHVESPAGKQEGATYIKSTMNVGDGGVHMSAHTGDIEDSGDYLVSFTLEDCLSAIGSGSFLEYGPGIQTYFSFDWDNDSAEEHDQTIQVFIPTENITLLDIDGTTLFGVEDKNSNSESSVRPTPTNMSCKVEKETYYNKEGKVVTKAEWEKACGEEITDVPDTNVNEEILIFIVGFMIAILGGMTIYKNRKA